MPRLHHNDDISNDNDIEYGIRGSRSSTTYHHRNSSSLHPSQRMEQEVYYQSAEIFSEAALFYGHIIRLLLTIYQRYMSVTHLPANIITVLRNKANKIKQKIQQLRFALSWVRCYSELALLYAEDLTVFIRRRNRFRPPKYRSMNDISQQDCDQWFGLSPHQLRLLFRHWRFPHTFIAASGHRFTGEECLHIFLYHLTKGSPYTDMARNVFGGDPRYFSVMFELAVDHLYYNFYNKISGNSLDQWLPTHLDLC